jgi:hypothetical protein
MKTFVLTCLYVAFTILIHAQTNGDFRSRQSGNYSNPSTWEVFNGENWINAGTTPNATSNTTIQTGHEVTIIATGALARDLNVTGMLEYSGGITLTIYGHLQISVTGVLRVLQTPLSTNNPSLNLYGHLIVDGQFDGYAQNGAHESRLFVHFLGNSDADISGSGSLCEFYEITVNKGNSQDVLLEALRPFTLIGAESSNQLKLNILNGTFKISSPSVIVPYFGTQTVCEATAKLLLNHSSASISWANAGTARIYGNLQIDQGTFGSGGNIQIYPSSSGNSLINNGTINCMGSLILQQKFTLNTGTIHIGADLIADANGPGEKGHLIVNGGICTIGTGNNQLRAYDGGIIEIHGGEVTIFGRVLFDNGSYPSNTIFQMSAGNLNIDPQHTNFLADNHEIVHFSNHTIVHFSGGTMTLVDPQAYKNSTGQSLHALNIRGTAGTKNFSGSTIRFGDGISMEAGNGTYPGFSIYINGNVQLGDVIINNPDGQNRQVIYSGNTGFMMNHLSLLSPNDQLIIGNHTLNVKGNLLNQGEIHFNAGYGELIFSGADPQYFSGDGNISEGLFKVSFNNTSPQGITLESGLGAQVIELIDGLVHTSLAGLLSVNGVNPENLIGGDENAYIKGPFRRAVQNIASDLDYSFPIGKDNFRMLTLNGLSTSGTGLGYITAEVFEGGSLHVNGHNAGNGLSNPTQAQDIYWQLTNHLNAINLEHISSVSLQYPNPETDPVSSIAQSNGLLNGTYQPIGLIQSHQTIQSESFSLAGFSHGSDAFLIVALRNIPPVINYTVGTGADFTNLTAVATHLRNNTVQGNVFFELTSNYNSATETIPILFDQVSLEHAHYRVTIRPQIGVGITLSRSSTNPLIILDNVRNITFDGRPGGIGNSNWTIENTRAYSNTPGPVFEFRNGAESNVLAYLQLKSDIQAADQGIITFSGTKHTKGNNYNSIQNCAITGYDHTYSNGVYSNDSTTYPNLGNTVENCEISDFFRPTIDPKGIYLGQNNSGWIVSNNRFFQTASRSFAQNKFFVPIHIDAPNGDNFRVTGNTIGGNNNLNTGNMVLGGASSRYAGIWLNVGAGNRSVVEGNEIKNIQLSTNYGGSDLCGVFSGIFIEQGNVEIGSSGIGNRIGSLDENDIIQIQNQNNGHSYGIKALNCNTIHIKNNKIGGLAITEVTSGNNLYFNGIWSNSGNVDISNNTIGSVSIADNIKIGSIANTGNTYFYGIYNNSAGIIDISENTVSNIRSNGTGTTGVVNGIYSLRGQNAIISNKINNLISYSRRNDADGNPAVCGIRKTSNISGQIISQNTIHSLRNMNEEGSICGISVSAGMDTLDVLSRNFIHSFDSDYPNHTISGIHIESGSVSVLNNMVRLGIDPEGNPVSESVTMNGIRVKSSDHCNFYHNSVYIGGSVTSFATTNSHAFFSSGEQSCNLLNNIFVNIRTNLAGGQRHYAIRLNSTAAVSSDYNIYQHAGGSSGELSYLVNGAISNLQTHRSILQGSDLHSGIGNPNFLNPLGNASNLSLNLTGNTPAFMTGIVLDGIFNDFNGAPRPGIAGEFTNIGADAGNYAITNLQDIFTPNFKYIPIGNQNPEHTAVFQVNISDQAPDGQGICQVNPPRMFYRLANSNNPSKIQNWEISRYKQGELQEGGNGKEGNWQFVLKAGQPEDDYPALEDGDMIEYFFVAQDKATSPNVWYSKFAGSNPLFSNVSTTNAWPANNVAVDYYGIGGSLQGTYTVGTGATDFPSLTGSKGLFQAINALRVSGNITAQIVSDISEPALYDLQQWTEIGQGGYTIQIKPANASVKTLTCSANVDFIRLNGADRLTIDGRFNESGRFLKFVQTNPSYSTLVFANDASHNAIKHTEISGRTLSSRNGTVKFLAGSSEGNLSNIIQGNLIDYNTEMPQNAIVSNGSSGTPNTNNSILANEIRNFAENGIWVSESGNDYGWVISDNSLYYNRTATIGGKITGIRIESGAAHHISGNVIGGNPSRPDGLWQITSIRDFHGIYLNVDNNQETNVLNNTILKIWKSSTSPGTNELRGIWAENGWTKISGNTFSSLMNDAQDKTVMIYKAGYPGEISNNTISDITTNGNADFYGIQVSVSPSGIVADIADNSMTNIKLNNSGSSVDFYGIYVNDGNCDIKRNTIGNQIVADDILIAGPNVSIIRVANSGQINAENNNLANITQTNTSNTATIKGFHLGGSKNNSVTGNTISHLNSYSTKTDYTDGILPVTGIWASGSYQYTISHNIISHLKASGNAGVHITGIAESAPFAQLSKNKIFNLINHSPGGTTIGIVLNRLDAGFVANNMISLGTTNNSRYIGIWMPFENTTAKKIYFNSVYIGGNADAQNSYAFKRGQNNTPMHVRNNIFANFRSGGAGKHYSVAMENTQNWSDAFINRNNYYCTNDLTTGLWGTQDVDFYDWISNTGENTLKLSNNFKPVFINPILGDLHLSPTENCAFNRIAEQLTGFEEDFDLEARSNNPDLGADEFTPDNDYVYNVWLGNSGSDWDNADNWQCSSVPSALNHVYIPDANISPVINRPEPKPTVILNELNIKRHGRLNISAGNSISLNGKLTVDGELILESPINSGPGASLIDNGVLSGSGEIQVHRFLKGGVYHYISTPLQAGGNASSSLFTSTGYGAFNPNFYLYNQAADLDANEATSPQPYDASELISGWEMAHHGSGGAAIPLNRRQGYSTYDVVGRNIIFRGLTNTGTIDIDSLGFTNNDPQPIEDPDPENLYDGWHLVGNPYPSTLDWDLIVEDGLTNLDNGIFVWDKDQYAGYKDGISVMSQNLDNRIAPMQGFFVKANAGSAGFKIRNSYRTHGMPDYLKSGKSTPNMLKLKASANGFDDYIAIRFKNGATDGYDNDSDLIRLYSSNPKVPNLYSISKKSKIGLSLNSLPEQSMNGCIVPLGLKMGKSDRVNISVSAFNHFEGIHVHLIDSLKGTSVSIRNLTEFGFSHPGGKSEGRFYLKFSQNNHPKVTKSIGDTTFLAGKDFQFSIPENTFLDSDFGDELKLSAMKSNGEPLPDWLIFEPNSGNFAGKSNETQQLEINVMASDLFGAQVSTRFKLSIFNTTNAVNPKEVNYQLFPNPANDKLFIQSPGQFNKGGVIWSIKDINGKNVFNGMIDSPLKEITVNTLAPGIYFLIVKNGNMVETIQFTKINE